MTEVEQKLSDVQTLLNTKSLLLANREQIRFQYLAEWRNRLETAVGAITYMLYSQIRDYADANLLFSAFSKYLLLQIPMTTLDGRPYVNSKSGLVYKNPGNEPGQWLLGGSPNVSFLSPIDDWIVKPYYATGVAAPAYRVNEDLIRSNAIQPILNQWSAPMFPMNDYDGLAIPWFKKFVASVPSLSIIKEADMENTILVVLTYIKWQYLNASVQGDTLNQIMIDGKSFYSAVVYSTRNALMGQLDLDAGDEALRDAVLKASAT